jgi:hypothetical protein
VRNAIEISPVEAELHYRSCAYPLAAGAATARLYERPENALVLDSISTACRSTTSSSLNRNRPDLPDFTSTEVAGGSGTGELRTGADACSLWNTQSLTSSPPDPHLQNSRYLMSWASCLSTQFSRS